MRKLLLTIFLLGALSAQAQSPRFSGLKAEGPIPADLRQTLDELYSQDKQRVRDYNDGRLTNRDNVLAASYQINQLMAGGRILYGDPVTRMVERIADTLLKDYPALRKELRFYTVKSPEVNAFATGQGMIFVNTGLVAQAEDEAQLAFVIGHEIIHYFKKHNLEVLTRKTKKTGREVEEEQLRNFLKYHNRSHQMENEADSLGLAMFYVDSPYDKGVCDGVFDVLQYGYLPFDELPFDTNYFTTPYYHLPAGRYLAQVAPITARDDYDDSKSSHPNLLKRRGKTADVLANYRGGSKFVTITREEFAEVQRLARFECIRQNLIHADYVRAFYDAYVLGKRHPDSQFLVEARAQALYALSKCRTYTNTSMAVGDYTEYEGEVQQLYYLFAHLTSDEMILMALREVWNAHLRFPQESRLTELAEDLAADLQKKYSLGRTAFAAVFDTATVAVDTVQQAAKNQKYERIKQKRRNQQSADMRRYVFTDFLMQDDSFASMLRRASERSAADSAAFTPRKNVFLYSPTYLVMDQKDADIKYRKSDRLESALAGQLTSVMAAKELGTVELTDKSLRSRSSAEEYNEYVAFNEWCNEFWQTKGDYGMSLFTQSDMNSLMEKYDANLLNLSLVLNAEYYNTFNPVKLFCSLAFPPAIPLVVYSVTSERERTNVTTLMVDTEHGRLLNKLSYDESSRDSKALVKRAVYDNLNQACAKAGHDSLSRAPVSGYMGRRFLFSVDGAVAFNRLGFKEGDGHQLFGMADSALLRPALLFNAEYVLSSNQSLTFSYRRNKVHTNQSYFAGTDTIDYGYGYYDINRNYKGCMLEETTHNFAISYRKYFHESAPLGTYWGIGATYSRLNLNTDGVGPLLLEEEGPQLPLNRFGVQLDFGRNYIFYDWLLLHIGVKYSLVFANPFQEKITFDSYRPAQKALHRLNADLLVSNCFLLTIGLGVLPF